MDKQFDKTPEEQIAEVLNRWSVSDLREMSDDDLDRGLERYNASGEVMPVRWSGEINFIRYWEMESNGNVHQVRRFENFAWCSCMDHFYSKTCCKHIAATTQAWRDERNKEADNAPYLGPDRGKGQLVGRIRV
jgi:hypothetical protein